MRTLIERVDRVVTLRLAKLASIRVPSATPHAELLAPIQRAE